MICLATHGKAKQKIELSYLSALFLSQTLTPYVESLSDVLNNSHKSFIFFQRTAIS